MMLQRPDGSACSYFADCESHGHRMTPSVFQEPREGAKKKRCVGVAEDIRNQKQRPGRARTSQIHSPENCTKPIKEDTVAFHAA
jgi:hypothetical protein